MRDTTQDERSVGHGALDELTDEQKHRLTDILDRYLRSLESGLPPPREQLLAAHSDLARPLAIYLDNLAELHDVAAAFGRHERAPRDDQPRADDEKRLGDFVLVRELGRGGMGVVYEARQISLARRVALKVLPFAAVLESRQIARFKNEAQAAAQLQHPNIVPVYAVGVERGVHYYAMQFIDGEPLDRAIAQLRPKSAAPQPRQLATTEAASTAGGPAMPSDHAASGDSSPGVSFLSRQCGDKQHYFRAVMRLGIQAAEALHAAHSYGIVHRDIKPSNLLLDDGGKLWITDFGLARCQGDLALTRTGDVMGTRQYMSPEQALGQAALVDQRSDVYSLGVTLYELATLRPAFAGDHATHGRQIERPEPVRPRELEPQMPTDLETVLLKAMARSRDERYLTAQELADDLARVLEGKPTVARPPTLLDRAGKFARRHRRVVAATAAVVLVATVGLAVSTILINREKTKAQADFARAEHNFHQAHNAVDALGSRFAERLAEVPGAEQARRELLDETLKYYQRFVEQAGNNPALRADLAMTYGKIGTLNDQMGLTAEAIAAHTSAITLLETLVADQPHTVEHVRRLAVCRNNLALALGRAGRHDEARRAFEQAIAAQQDLVARDPDSRSFRAELALSHNNLGNLERETGQTAAAGASFREAIRLAEQVRASAPRDAEALRSLAAAYNNLAALDSGADRAEAVALYARASDCLRVAVESRRGDAQYHRELATTLNNLGAAQAKSGQINPAAAAYREAIELQKDLVRAAPLSRAYRRDLAVSYNNLGLAQAGAHQSDLAERCFRNALGFQGQLVKEQPQDIELQSAAAGMHNNLGIVLEQIGRLEAAAQSYAQAVELQQAAHAHAPTVERYRTFLSKHYYNYGRAQRQLGRRDEAVRAALERKKLWQGNPERLFSVAEELALASKLEAADKAHSPTAERYADLAVATLREAVAAGLRVPPDLDRREAFVAVRGRPGFLELLE
jgi:serine/threonine protein kinase/tetratricopeptide (TPR) repeat protein